MKVLLIGNAATDAQFSMLGFLGALRSGLEDQGVTVRAIAPQARLALSQVCRRRPATQKWFSYLDKYLLFPPVLRREIARFQPDVIHICDQGNAMYVPYVQTHPHVITCHDLLAVRSASGEILEQRTGGTGRIYQRLILRGLSQARHIACVSEATRADVTRIVKTPSGRRAVLLPNGLYSPFAPLPLVERLPFLKRIDVDPERPFLLHIGGNQFYKNRPGVLRIYAALRRYLDQSGNAPNTVAPPDLVMVGKAFTPEMRRTIENDTNLSGRVHERSGVDQDGLRALYSHAQAFLFPSLYEGFGMPVIEAQACGCPVFTSDRAPLTEIGGVAAGYIDPEQPEQAARFIAERLSRPGERERMISLGYENVRSRFTTERMINDYIVLYEQVRTADFLATKAVSAQAAKDRA